MSSSSLARNLFNIDDVLEDSMVVYWGPSPFLFSSSDF
jgi:hypothetical protein